MGQSKYAISVVITTFNEAQNIEAALKSVSWADEKIVVDSFSTDETVALASADGATVFQRAYKSPSDQKNWAIAKAQHEWVFILDADERATPDLSDEIRQTVGQSEAKEAYWIQRESWFMGRKIRFSGWQGDKVVRLIRRDVCRYDEKKVHEEIEISNLRVGQLKGKLEHFTFKNLTHFIQKTERYAVWSAQDYSKKTPRVTFFHLFVKPYFRFFKHFILKRGFLDGKAGFVISVLAAWGVFLRYAYLQEERTAK